MFQLNGKITVCPWEGRGGEARGWWWWWWGRSNDGSSRLKREEMCTLVSLSYSHIDVAWWTMQSTDTCVTYRSSIYSKCQREKKRASRIAEKTIQSHNYRAFSNFSPVTSQIRFCVFFPSHFFLWLNPTDFGKWKSLSSCLNSSSLFLRSQHTQQRRGKKKKQWRKISGEERGTVALSW